MSKVVPQFSCLPEIKSENYRGYTLLLTFAYRTPQKPANLVDLICNVHQLVGMLTNNCDVMSKVMLQVRQRCVHCLKKSSKILIHCNHVLYPDEL